MAHGTTNTPIRFTPQDKAKVRAIQERYGLGSFAEAVRYAVNRCTDMIAAADAAAARRVGARARTKTTTANMEIATTAEGTCRPIDDRTDGS